jgi:uncharacterized membrane protein YgdD (TMEM256/DUF423 family)
MAWPTPRLAFGPRSATCAPHGRGGIGTLLFAGSLYALALGAPRGMAALAPVGGVAMLLGWVSVLLGARR